MLCLSMYREPPIWTALFILPHRMHSHKFAEREPYYVYQTQNLSTTFKVDPFTGKSDILFADFLLSWFNIIPRSVDIVTYASHATNIKSKVVPYFRDKNYTLKDLEENPTFMLTVWI